MELSKNNWALKCKNFLRPRKKTSIEVENGHVLKSAPKTDIEGEIYYYSNLPESIEHLFPEYFVSVVMPDRDSANSTSVI